MYGIGMRRLQLIDAIAAILGVTEDPLEQNMMRAFQGADGKVVEGAWFDPSDFARYMAPGPELVTNRDFANGLTGWKLTGIGQTAGSISVSDGVVTLTRGGMTAALSQDVPTTPGKRYELSGELLPGGTGQGFFTYLGSPSVVMPVGRHTVVFTATSYTTNVGAQVYGAIAGHSIRFKSISVRELPALSTASLFQDAAGTTPVTAVEQPVGLMLDRRFDLARGPELVVNGSFNSGLSGWTIGSDKAQYSVTAGRLRVETLVDRASGQNVSQSLATQAGKTYEMTVGVEASMGARVGISLANARFTVAAGTHTVRCVFTSPAGNDLLTLENVQGSQHGSVGSVNYFDNITVREIAGNHASQATTTARPTLSARVNQFPRSDQVTWSNKSNVVANPLALHVPELSTYLAEFLETESTGQKNTNSDSGGRVSFVAGQPFTFRILAKSVGRNLFISGPSSTLVDLQAVFDLVAGTVVSSNPGTSAKIEPYRDGMFWCEVSATPMQTQSSYVVIGAADGVARSYVGDPTKGFMFGAPDFRVAVPNAPKYQRVSSATDYDWKGFPLYLKFDGIDDCLQTAAVNLTAHTGISFWAALRQDSAAREQQLFMFGDNYKTQAGSMGFGVGVDEGMHLSSYMTGTGDVNGLIWAGHYTAPVIPEQMVVSSILDIAGKLPRMWRNGSLGATAGFSSQSPKGTAGNYPIYLGKSPTPLGSPFAGAIYAIGFRGGAVLDTARLAGERFVGRQMGLKQ